MSKPKKSSSTKPSAKKAAPKKAAPKTPPKKAKGRAGTHTSAQPSTPTIDNPPKGEREAPAKTAPVERDTDGREPVPGGTLLRALKYVHAVAPKEDGLVFYTHDASGRPLVSGHNNGASFTFYLPLKAVWEVDIAVPSKESRRLLKLLDGLPASAMVRVYADGRAVIRHDVAQPEVVVNLGTRAIVDAWQPPSKADRKQSLLPLRMDAAVSRKARNVPDSVARAWQSECGIEWVDLCDADNGDTLARAVIAEDGRDLYHEDSRQTEIGGSRTAGVTNTSKMDAATVALEDLRNKLAANGATITVVSDGRSTAIGEAPTEPAPPGAPETVPPARADDDGDDTPVRIESTGEV